MLIESESQAGVSKILKPDVLFDLRKQRTFSWQTVREARSDEINFFQIFIVLFIPFLKKERNRLYCYNV